MFGRKLTPQEKIIKADNKKQRYRDKRSKLDRGDPGFDKKDKKLMGKIHKQNVIIDTSKMELKHPQRQHKTTNVTTNVNLTKNDSSKSLHLHGHYHSSEKKKK